MKPEKGLEDMEDKLYDPRELFADIGMLVTEARTPESSKGRVEGPHCRPLQGTNDHECDRHKEQCRKACDILSQQDILWQNKIPMRIDVLLFPDCEHGYREETIVEGAIFSCLDNFELLERWDVQLVKKRSPERIEGFVNGHVHLQAARSYLHFSQLSSWLISAGGALPLRVVYRIYAPGESMGYTFSKLPEVHNFPAADLGDVVIRTTVTHLPRKENPLLLVCRSWSPGVEQHLRSRKLNSAERCLQTSSFVENVYEPKPSTSKCDDDCTKNSITRKKTHLKDKMEYGKEGQQQTAEKPPIGRKMKAGKNDTQSKLKAKPCPISNTPKRKVDQLSPTIQDPHIFSDFCQSLHGDDIHQKKDSVSYSTAKLIPTLKNRSETPQSTLSLVNSVTSDHTNVKLTGQILPIKNHPYQKPTTLAVSTNSSLAAAKRLPSPKVLVTGSRKPEPSVYKKRCLDLEAPECIQENVEEFVNLKQLDEFTASDIRDLIKPLSPSDLEAYLSSLSNKAPPRKPGTSKLEDIPTTKCSFYLSENDDIAYEKNDSKIETNIDVDRELCDIQSTTAQSLSNISGAGSLETDVPVCSVKTDISAISNPVKVGKKQEKKHVRVLFRKSLSTSEVEIGHKTLSLFDETIDLENNDLKSDSRPVCDKNLRVENEKTEKVKTKKLDKHVPGRYSEQMDGENSLKRQLPEVASTTCDSSNINYVCQSNLPTQESLSRETIQSSSKRERTLNELSIPCRIGNVNNAMTTLVQNLESMDIDDRPSTSNGSPTYDNEVEKHLNSEYARSDTNLDVNAPNNLSSSNSSDSCDSASPTSRGLSLCKQLLRKEFHQNVTNEILRPGEKSYKNLPSPDDIKNFQFIMGRSVCAIFNSNTGLPSRSSPAPIKKISSNRFDYDCTLTNVRAIKNALSCSKLTLQSEDNGEAIEDPRVISTSAPASTNCLLGNFEESVLNGRIEPVGVVDGFHVEIGAGGTFCPKHITLPVTAYFFQLSDDNAPSPYLGHVNLEPLGKRGYHIPRTGTVQVTLFNPNKTVVKMFVVMYDLSDMPANCQTFLRQRTIYMPADENSSDPSFLRYLIHLRFASSKSGKIYLHTDIRLIFARDKFEFDPRVANYELRSFTEGPENPKFSPKR